jgi:hypothetical protein
MNDDDLDRVRADLATMQSVCAEPAVPSEEIRIWLFLAACGLVLATAVWFVPVLWIRLATLIVFVIGAGVYIPYQRRLIRNSLSHRYWTVPELKFQAVGAAGVVAYFLFRRFVHPGTADYGWEVWRQDGSAAFFAIGLGILGYCFSRASRRRYLASGVGFMIGGIAMQFADSRPAVTCIVGVMLAVASLGNAAGSAWAMRSHRGKYVSG